jgi:hypothetical protein
MSHRLGFLSVVRDILPAGAKAILGVDPLLNLQEINSDLVEVMIDGGVPQHFRNGCMSGGGLRNQRCEKKRANDCIFHSRIMASN